MPTVPPPPGDLAALLPEDLRGRFEGGTTWAAGWRDGVRDTFRFERDACAGAVAVMGFQNLSGSPGIDWISGALTEMLATELAVDEKLRIVPGESVSRARRELGLGGAESYGRESLTRIRQSLCAEYVLVGSYLGGEGGAATLRLDLRLQDTRSGETLAQVAETGSVNGLIELVTRAGGRLRGVVGAGGPAGEAQARALLPKNTTAARLYAEGLDRLHREECADAQALLERSVQADGEFALARASLAEALYCVGYEERASQEAEKALALAEGLPRRERLTVQASAWSMTGQPEQAAAAWKELFDFFPDDLHVGLALAGHQLRLGRRDEVRVTIAALRKLRGADAQHPRIDLLEAKMADMEGDRAAQKAALERSLARAESHGYRLMAGAALMDLTYVYLDEGDLGRAEAAAQKTHDIGVEFGDRELEVIGMDVLGTIAVLRGDLAGGSARYQEALAIVAEVGLERRRPALLRHLALAPAAAGRLDAAAATTRLAQKARARMGKNKDRDKDVVAAFAKLEQAHFKLLRGDARGARTLAAEVVEEARGRQDLPLVSEALGVLACAARASGDDDAGDLLLEAQGLYTQRGRLLRAMDIEIELIRHDTEHAAAAAAAQRGEALLARAASSGASDLEAVARSAWALALAAAGRPDEARAAIAPAMSWASRTQNVLTLVVVGLADAQLLGAGDEEARELAVRRLALLMEVARKAGLAGHEMQAGLALGELAIAGGQAAVGRQRLLRIEKRARAMGLDAVARRAAEAQTTGSAKAKANAKT
jgi:TolB-like protein